MPQYSPEEIRVVAEEAARRGSYVAAHAYSAEAIAVAVANGVRSIEHGNLLDAPTAALMAERGAFLVPTLVTYDAMERRGAELGLAPVARAKNREVLDAGRAAIGLAREAGVRIGSRREVLVWWALAVIIRSGYTPLAFGGRRLRAATVDAALLSAVMVRYAFLARRVESFS